MTNLEAEKSVIGSIIIKNELYDTALELGINYNSFSNRLHSKIFKSFKALEKIDPITISEKLSDDSERDYVYDILEAVPTTANFNIYCDLVINSCKRRYVQKVIKESEVLLKDDLPDITVNKIITDLEKISKADKKIKVSSISDIYDDLFHEMSNPNNKDDTFCFGFNTFAKDIQIMGGDLVLIAARPSMGKTAYAINIAERLSNQGKVGLFLSLEMSAKVLGRRMLSSITRIKSWKLRNNNGYKNLTDKEYAILGEKCKIFKEMPLEIADITNTEISSVKNLIKQHKRTRNIDYVIIDYLQLIRATGSNGRVEEVTEISLQLKNIARELDIPVIALSQLSRSVEQRSDKRPELSDLRESGQLEQDASIVQFLYRDVYYNENSEMKTQDGYDIVEVITKKNREGATGTENLVFAGEIQRMFEMSDAVEKI